MVITSINNKNLKLFSIFLSISIIVLMIVDSTIVKTFGYVESRIPGIIDIIFFTIFVTIFIITNIILILLTKKFLYDNKNPTGLNPLFVTVVVNQLLISLILVIIIIQMITFSSYDVIFLMSIVLIAFISSVGISAIMIGKFFQWFKDRKKYLLLLYIIAFSFLIIKSIVAVIYLQQELVHHSPWVEPNETRLMILNLSNINAEVSEILRSIYNYTSILFFLSFWITTSLMLREYSTRYGKTRYWILMGIPLIFFLIQDYIIGLDFFTNLLLYSPNFLGMVYTIFPNLLLLAVGICFALGILKGTREINNEAVSNALMISAIGIVLLVGSFEIFGVFVGAYPPHGLVTISYMGLASFLFLIGIFSFARSVTSDILIKNQIYKLLDSQIIKDIGISEVTNNTIKNVEKLLLQVDENDNFDRNELTEDELKRILNEVVNELREIKEKDTASKAKDTGI